jgi:hypothetical protein
VRLRGRRLRLRHGRGGGGHLQQQSVLEGERQGLHVLRQGRDPEPGHRRRGIHSPHTVRWWRLQLAHEARACSQEAAAEPSDSSSSVN